MSELLRRLNCKGVFGRDATLLTYKHIIFMFEVFALIRRRIIVINKAIRPFMNNKCYRNENPRSVAGIPLCRKRKELGPNERNKWPTSTTRLHPHDTLYKSTLHHPKSTLRHPKSTLRHPMSTLRHPKLTLRHYLRPNEPSITSD